MGKDKSGQRTKGNLKPSSSGRSAELLGGAAGFVGFSGLSDLGYVPAASQGTVDDDTHISGEFRVTLRKMSKKDAITKIKALQEFESLCSSEDIDSMKTALPYWPRLYCKLSLDCERRVREAAHSAHSSFVTQIGKHLAPYLRSIMPCWLLSMTDPHIPAAVAASKSFQAAFSEEKRPGVMIFCAKEIIDFILDNLFVQTPETLSDPSTSTKEDQEGKYIRILFCSLKALCLFLETTSLMADKKAEIVAKLNPIINHDKFWKLEKHDSSLVRSAWYDTIKSLFEYDVNILKAHVAKLTKAVFSALDCPDNIVLPHVWISFLHLCVGLPECWEHCGKPQSVFNRIFSVLRDGGRSNAGEICPQLLPILSVIPISTLEMSSDFYIDFFKAISASLRKERVISNRREVFAIIIALNECLRYMSKEHGENQELWNIFTKYQVVDLLVSSFTDLPQLSDTNLYHEVGKLLLYWCNVSEGENKSKHADKLNMFWKLFLPECDSWIKEANDKKLLKLKYFFKIIKDPNGLVSKRSKGVRFEEGNSDEIPSFRTASKEISKIKNYENSYFSNSLTSVLSPLIQNCFETFLKTENEKVFHLFAFLLYSFSSDETYVMMIKEKVSDPLLAKKLFLEETILPLLEDSKTPSEALVDVLIHVYLQLDTENQKSLLLNLKPTIKVGALRFLIMKMSERCSDDSIAAMWLKSPQLGCRLVKYIQQLFAIVLAEGSRQSLMVQEEYLYLLELFEFVFSNGYKNRIVFSLEYVGQMLKSLEVALKQFEMEHQSAKEDFKVELLTMVTKFINIHLNSYVSWKADCLIDNFKALYHRLFNPFYLHLNYMNQVRNCILEGLKQNIINKISEGPDSLLPDNDNLLLYLLKESKNMLLNQDTGFNITLKSSKFLESIFILLFKSLPQNEDCCIILDHSMIQNCLEVLLPTEMEWTELEKSLCPLYTAPSILFGTLICREFPLPKTTKDPQIWDQRYIRICLLVTKILISLCSPIINFEEEIVECKNAEDVSLGQFTRLAVFALHGACHSNSLLHMKLSLNNNEVTEDIKMGTNCLGKAVSKLLSRINDGNKMHIVKLLTDRCSHGSTMWSITLGHTIKNWIGIPINAAKLIAGINEDYLGYTETKQIFVKLLDEEQTLLTMKEETGKLSSLFEDPFSALPSVCIIMSTFERLADLNKKNPLSDDSVQVIKDCIHTVYSVLVSWRENAANIFLFASDLKDVVWEEVSLMVSIIRLLTIIVKDHSLHLLHSHWDVTLCAVSSWTQSLLEAKNPASNTNVTMFASACSKCGSVISDLINKLKKDSTLRSEYPPTLLEEWDEFFAPSIFQTLIAKLIECNSVYQKERSVLLYSLCRSLAVSVGTVNSLSLNDISLPELYNVVDAESQFQLPEKLQTLLNHFAPVLLSYHPPCQYASYKVLEGFLPSIMASLEECKTNLDDQDDLPQRPLPFALVNVIQEAGVVVESALHDKEFGSSCELVPHTDAHTYTGGYLLAWVLALTAIMHAADPNQQLYSAYIRESGLLVKLLNNLFKLMPPEPKFEKKPSTQANLTMFTTDLVITPIGKISSELISWLACQVYMRCLTQLPAAVRNWFTNLDRCSQLIVEKFTTTHVSPILIANEINTVNDSTVKFENMVIKCRPGAREIVATYTIDEASGSMELVLHMAANHPLSTITLEDHKRVGVSIAQWRNWLFGLNTMLSHRNTPLLNSLEFWKKNVDQKFQGVEECYICYYILHGTNHQIPKLLCRTCKKKFHSACMYKWFSTSNNSTCPICRSLF